MTRRDPPVTLVPGSSLLDRGLLEHQAACGGRSGESVVCFNRGEFVGEGDGLRLSQPGT